MQALPLFPSELTELGMLERRLHSRRTVMFSLSHILFIPFSYLPHSHQALKMSPSKEKEAARAKIQ